MIIQTPAATLRTDLFKTKRRDSTDRILVRYTRTEADPRIDAEYLDMASSARGYLGIPFHYLILVSGTVEIGRNPNVIAAYGRKIDTQHQIVVGVVGGLNSDGGQIATMDAGQSEALEELLQGLADAFGVPLEVTDNTVLSEIKPPSSSFDRALRGMFDQVDSLVLAEEAMRAA